MENNSKVENFFSTQNEVKNNFMKFNAVGDTIMGKLREVHEVESKLPDQAGQMQKIYEIEAEAGFYHELDERKQLVEKPVELIPGNIYCVGGKKMVDEQMRRAVPGQTVGLRFVEERPNKTKGFNAIKIIKVYMMDLSKELQERMDQAGV